MAQRCRESGKFTPSEIYDIFSTFEQLYGSDHKHTNILHLKQSLIRRTIQNCTSNSARSWTPFARTGTRTRVASAISLRDWYRTIFFNYYAAIINHFNQCQIKSNHKSNQSHLVVVRRRPHQQKAARSLAAYAGTFRNYKRSCEWLDRHRRGEQRAFCTEEVGKWGGGGKGRDVRALVSRAFTVPVRTTTNDDRFVLCSVCERS
jgi:hypothetical protein